MSQPSGTPATGHRHPYGEDLEAERRGWYELAELVRSLTPEECLEAGYYEDAAWTVRDVVAHLGTWLAEAEVQFERMSAGTYEGHAIDVDGLNARFLAAMAGQPWQVAWLQANAGRTMMIEAWHELREPTDEAAWWIRKSGAEHFAEHLEPLRGWVAELIARRVAEPDVPAQLSRACPYHRGMSRRADPERIHLARRAAIRNVIMESRGLDHAVAEQWCDAWEAEAALRGLEPGSAYWDAGKAWIDAQCAARKRPPN